MRKRWFEDYRGYIGHPDGWDLLAANQFNTLTELGLRQHHKVLDIGCGSLRLGRLLMPYLARGHYFGVEPEEKLLEQGIEEEIGWEYIEKRAPSFNHERNFSFDSFGTSFDYIMAHSIFTHTEPELLIECASSAAKVLNNQGLLVLTIIENHTSCAKSGGNWIYPDCLSFHPQHAKDLFYTAGLNAYPINLPHTCQHWWLAEKL